jgi:hypothetical protein
LKGQEERDALLRGPLRMANRKLKAVKIHLRNDVEGILCE